MTIKGKQVALLFECLSATCLAGGGTNLISDATIRNWSRVGGDVNSKLRTRANKRLSAKHVIPHEYFRSYENVRLAEKITDEACISAAKPCEVIYSLAVELLKQEGNWGRASVRRIMAEYSQWSPKCVTWDLRCPKDEPDWLGIIYQCLLPEGERNEGGIYYTQSAVVEDMASHCRMGKESLFLDPCCGSGAMFFSLKDLSPQNVFGIDKDPVAVFIAKLNLLRIYQNCEFEPQIYCFDYLNPSDSQRQSPVLTKTFDCIMTNPPWGAVQDLPEECAVEITSGETFALFYIKAYKQLKPRAVISFLLPESVLNVRTHRDFRKFMLQNGNLESITCYSGSFSGVITKYVGIVCNNTLPSSDNIHYIFKGANDKCSLSRKVVLSRDGLELTYVAAQNQTLLDKISSAGVYDLSHSDWALGIVTGDNKRKLSDDPVTGMEPIFTGKEVTPYRLKAPRKYVRYDRSQFQQVAKESYYRAPEKLVYKFIADRPIFAYDDSGALFLNSANILIPHVEGMSAKTVLALLNSDVMQFYYCQRFGGVKVLKSNLCALPFPRISREDDIRISNMSSSIIDGDSSGQRELQYIIGNCYGVSSNEVDVITEKINGKTN